MIAAEKTVLVLLAAGRSKRFGEADKLREDFLGRPLACHVVTALEAVPFLARVAVTSGEGFDFAEQAYDVVVNPDPDQGLSSSVKLGVEAAQRRGAAAVLFALADMPRVTATHIYRLLDAADSADAVVASSNGEHPTPPALFAAGQFRCLKEMAGTEGARELVRGGKHVVTSPAELIDIDTPEDLAKLRELVQPGSGVRQ